MQTDVRLLADTAALPYDAFGDHMALPEVAVEAAAAEAARSVPGKRILVKHKMSFHRARIRAVRPLGPLARFLPHLFTSSMLHGLPCSLRLGHIDGNVSNASLQLDSGLNHSKCRP